MAEMPWWRYAALALVPLALLLGGADAGSLASGAEPALGGAVEPTPGVAPAPRASPRSAATPQAEGAQAAHDIVRGAGTGPMADGDATTPAPDGALASSSAPAPDADAAEPPVVDAADGPALLDRGDRPPAAALAAAPPPASGAAQVSAGVPRRASRTPAAERWARVADAKLDWAEEPLVSDAAEAMAAPPPLHGVDLEQSSVRPGSPSDGGGAGVQTLAEPFDKNGGLLATRAADAQSDSLAPAEPRRLFHEERAAKVTVFPTILLRAGGAGRGSGPYALDAPSGVAVDAAGRVYVSDTKNHRVLRYAADNASAPETVAGGHGRGSGLDQLCFPRGLSIAATSGDLYVADAGNHRVVKWAEGASEGVVVAGQAGPLYDRQGNIIGHEPCCRAGRTMEELVNPNGVFADSDGNVYVADTGNNRVQLWTYFGTVSTVAGNTSGGAPLSSTLRRPEGVFLHDGVLYIADTGHDRVVAWAGGATEGEVVAGSGAQGDNVGQLRSPVGVWVDDSFTVQGVGVPRLYCTERYKHRVTRYTLLENQGDTSIVVAGECLQSPPYVSPPDAPCINGGWHYPYDPGPDTRDHLNPSNTNPPIYHFFGPSGLALRPSADGLGRVDITVADTQNHRVLTWLG